MPLSLVSPLCCPTLLCLCVCLSGAGRSLHFLEFAVSPSHLQLITTHHLQYKKPVHSSTLRQIVRYLMWYLPWLLLLASVWIIKLFCKPSNTYLFVQFSARLQFSLLCPLPCASPPDLQHQQPAFLILTFFGTINFCNLFECLPF